MGLETATYISDLVSTNPVGATDPKSQGDDHVRLIKAVLKSTFPNVNAAVNPTPTELNLLVGMLALKGVVSNSSTPYTVLAASQNKLHKMDATSGAMTVNLPTAVSVGAGWTTSFIKVDSSANAVTLTRAGSDLINGAATFAMSKQYSGVRITSDGTNWFLQYDFGVVGPSSSTDNKLIRWDGTNGALVQEAKVTVDDNGIVTIENALNGVKGSNIASATTTDIGAATGNVVDVTGTTTITGLGTIAAGVDRIVRFTGALTLTHNASSLILPGGANITTANGDIAHFISLGSGNWFCASYTKADGTPVVAPAAGGDSVILEVNNASAASTVVLTLFNHSSYDLYEIELQDIFQSSSQALNMTVGSGGGPTYASAGYSYHSTMRKSNDAGTPTYLQNTSTSSWVAGPQENANTTNDNLSNGVFIFSGFSKTAVFKGYRFVWHGANSGAGGNHQSGGGMNTDATLKAATVTAVKFAPASGTVTGRFILKGRKKS